MKKLSLTEQAINLLQSIIKTPSFSRQEDSVADMLEKFIKDQGLPLERIGNNLLILDKKRYLKEPTLLLNSHIDTVKPVSSWSEDPFGAELKKGILYGLGSNDAGASLICLLLTTIELYDKLPFNLAFCASAEEEVSGKNGISLVLKQYDKFDLAIVGEPTGMQPAVAEKGLMVLDCLTTGVAGHAARKDGVNAIYKAINEITWFKDFYFPKVSSFLGPVQMSVTQVEAGSQHNVVPDKCSFVVDIRGNGCYTNEELLEIIETNTSCEVKARSTRLNSSQLHIEHPFYKHLISQGYKPFGSPTLSDQALMGFPSIKLGPGESARSHTANEYIKVSEIEHALLSYKKLIESFRF